MFIHVIVNSYISVHGTPELHFSVYSYTKSLILLEFTCDTGDGRLLCCQPYPQCTQLHLGLEFLKIHLQVLCSLSFFWIQKLLSRSYTWNNKTHYMIQYIELCYRATIVNFIFSSFLSSFPHSSPLFSLYSSFSLSFPPFIISFFLPSFLPLFPLFPFFLLPPFLASLLLSFLSNKLVSEWDLFCYFPFLKQMRLCLYASLLP